MIEVGRQREALAQDIRRIEIDVDCVCAARRLGVVALDATDECLIILEREVGIERKIVAHALLRTLHLKHSVEAHDLITGTDRNAAR